MKKFILVQILFLVIVTLVLVGGKVYAQSLKFPIPAQSLRLPDFLEKTEIKNPLEKALCIEVITPAQDLITGECKNFPTPCDVPKDWKKIEKCEGDLDLSKDEVRNKKPLIKSQPSSESENSVSPVPSFEVLKPVPRPATPDLNSTLSESKTFIRQVPVLVNLCATDDNSLKEINELVKKADALKTSGDLESEKEIREKIRLIKEKINLRREECQKSVEEKLKKESTSDNQSENSKPILSKSQQEGFGSFCNSNLKDQLDKKIDYYKSLISLSLEELKIKGYEKQELAKILADLQNERAKLIAVCSGEKKGLELSQSTLILKPVAPEGAQEIVDYVKEKTAQVILQAQPSAEAQLEKVKEIKQETTLMAKELIRSQNRVSVKELQPVIEKFIFEPGKIKLENEETKITVPEAKKIEVGVKNKSIELLVSNNNLSLKEGETMAETKLPLIVENEKLIVNDKEVKITPKQLIEKLVVKNPTDLKVELTSENDKPIYQVKSVEKRNLLFLIPVKVEREVTVDATTEQAEKIKEVKPWWSFLAF